MSTLVGEEVVAAFEGSSLLVIGGHRLPRAASRVPGMLCTLRHL